MLAAAFLSITATAIISILAAELISIFTAELISILTTASISTYAAVWISMWHQVSDWWYWGEKEVDRAEQLRYVRFEVAALNALEVVLLDTCFFLDTILGGSIKKGKGLSLLIYHCLLIHDRLQVMIAICCSLVPWCDNHITGEVVWRHIGIPPWPHLLVTCGNIVTWPFRGLWLKKAAFKF